MDPWINLSKLSAAELRKLQDKRLECFINNYLYPFSPHYRKIFDDNKINPKDIKSVDDLKRIPFTSKADFVSDDPNKEKAKDFIQQPTPEKIKQAWGANKLLPLACNKIFKGAKYVEHQMNKEFRPVFMTFTTGTTNKPVSFFYSNYDIQNLYTSGARMLNLFEIDRDERIVNSFPYAPHLAFWQVVFGGFASCNLALSTGGGKVMGTEGNIGAIMKMKPSVVLGVPSYIYHLFREAREKNCKMDFVKKVVLGAAKVTVAFKKKLAEILESMGAHDVSIFGTYGFTEARCAWAESPTKLDESSGYHLYPDKEIFEVIDPKTGDVRGEGEDGELVYTSIDSRASSVIRYRTGDFVKGGIIYSPCQYSGRTAPRISSDISRLSDIKDLNLSKVKGALVNFSNFAGIFSEVELVDEWQIELRKKNNDPFDMDQMVVYVTAKPNSDEEQVEEEIRKQMTLTTEVSPNEVKFIPMPEMVKRLELETANKEKRILDNRPKA